MTALSPLDPSSYSRPEIAVIKHVSLSLNVDFECHTLSGSALLDIDILEDTGEVILDSSHLTIDSVELEDGRRLEYREDHLTPKLYGTKLTISLPKVEPSGEKNDENDNISQENIDVNSAKCVKECQEPGTFSLSFTGFVYELTDEVEADFHISKVETDLMKQASSCKNCSCKELPKVKIRIKYNTSPNATALQWLEPSQTSGKKYPYLFSQCQPIHARSILPCQDTPAVKFTYEAEVTAPEEFTVLMSALREKSHDNKTTFRQPIPIPSYLLAIAVGVLESRRLGPSRYLGPVTLTDIWVAARLESVEGHPKVLLLADKSVYPPSRSFLIHPPTGNSFLFLAHYTNNITTHISLVWSEKEEIERSAWEFAETEKYLQAAERLCGPYQWTQYDLLVLPPSFPYGGMENPCLTFVTPTLLAGDRSQAEVIVHEIMHSWTGNLVTNRNFEHFWLNEGFTVFLERKVGASLIADVREARRNRDFHSLLGLQELSETVNEELGVTNPFTKLVVDLKGAHPDDAFSTVPYEKGSVFLRYLENLFGGPEVFDEFLRSYLNKFQKKSIDTDMFKDYLMKYFNYDKESIEKLNSVDWQSWLHATGMPPIIPDYDTSMTKAVSALIVKITAENSTFSYDDVKTFTPHQVVNLLQELIDRPPLPLVKLHTLGETYKVNDTKNSEILYRWLRLCIRSKDQDKLKEYFDFVNTVGRMKFVRPIYRDLYAWEDVRQQVIDNFLKNEPSMMHVTAYTVRKDLHLNKM